MDYNLLLGYQAGKGTATYQDNTGQKLSIGYNITCLVTGCDNVIISKDAARFISCGNDNILVGREAGYCNCTATSNVFIGATSGRCNTTEVVIPLLERVQDIVILHVIIILMLDRMRDVKMSLGTYNSILGVFQGYALMGAIILYLVPKQE